MNNIYKKMSDITAELSAVAKNLEVGFGKNAYKAVGEADVLAAVKPLEVKHGIYSYPSKRRVIESQVMITNGYDGKEKQNQFVRVETDYTFINIENPEEKITVTSYGDGVDSQDKAVGKAMTYADKYALLKAYKIITGEDPDQYASESGKFVKKTESKPAPEPIPATKEQVEYIKDMCKAAGITTKEVFSRLGIKGKDFTVADFHKTKQYIENHFAEPETE